MLEKLLSPQPMSDIPMKLVIHKSQLLELINAQLENQGDTPIPGSCDIYFHVPGGGDYSDCSLYMEDKEVPVTVEWKEAPSKKPAAPAEVPYDPVEAAIKAVNDRFSDWRPTPAMVGYARAVAAEVLRQEQARVQSPEVE